MGFLGPIIYDCIDQALGCVWVLLSTARGCATNGLKQIVNGEEWTTACMVIDWLIEQGFNVSANTVKVIWETFLQVERLNQRYQSSESPEGKSHKIVENQKSKQHKIQQHNKETHIQKTQQLP